MAAAIVQTNSGAQNTGLATVAATLASPATAGNTLVLVVGGDDYKTGNPTGTTLSTGMSQETFLGHYLWWKVAAGGETSISYTIGSASPSCWAIMEISGLTATPYDTSNGQLAASGGSSYTTPAITPTTGDRFLVASMGGSSNSGSMTEDTWLSSFTERADIGTTLGSGTRDVIGVATLAVTANGSTAYSSGANFTGSPQARTGLIIAFKVASGGSTLNGDGTRATTATIAAAGQVIAQSAGNEAVTANRAGVAAVDRPVGGNEPVTAALAGTAAVDRPVAGGLGVTATITGAATVTSGLAADGTLPVTVAAAGVAQVAAQAAGATAISAAITGAATVSRMAQGDLAVTATETGTAARSVPATGNLAIAAAETGAGQTIAQAAGNLPITVTAAGLAGGIAIAGTETVTAMATGSASVDRPVGGGLAVSAAATGTATVSAAAAGSTSVAATITGGAGLAMGNDGARPVTASIVGAASVDSPAGPVTSVTVQASRARRHAGVQGAGRRTNACPPR